jgi:hypothetical protein
MGKRPKQQVSETPEGFSLPVQRSSGKSADVGKAGSLPTIAHRSFEAFDVRNQWSTQGNSAPGPSRPPRIRWSAAADVR